MKGRTILLVALIVVIGLVGCSQEPALAPTSGEAAGGQSVSNGTLRIEDDNNTVLFTIDGERIYRGTVQDGHVDISFDGDTMRRGASSTGEELFTVDDDHVFTGPSTNGPIAYTIDTDGKVHEGDGQGVIIYTIAGSRVFVGSGTDGPIAFDANADFDTEIYPVLPVLLDQRF